MATPILPVITKNSAALDSGSSTPFLSVVIPCYNTAEYLPHFLESISGQQSTPQSIELVFVVDGCPEHSEEIIADWMNTQSKLVTLIVQENQGPGAARNRGIEAATGEWITFLDSDDTFSDNYFSSIFESIETTSPDIHMHVTRLVRVSEDGKSRFHALDFKWNTEVPDNVVDLEVQHELIQLSGATVVLRRSELDDPLIRFDERLRSRFEDAHVIARYLLNLERPRYRLVPNAIYYYRAHATSLVAQSRDSLEIYGDIMNIAFRDLMQQAGAQCPTWLSNTLLYEMSWIFTDNLRLKSSISTMSSEAQAQFDSLTREFLQWVGSDNIRAYHVTYIPLAIRSSWEAVADPISGSGFVLSREYDPVRQLQRVVVHTAQPNDTITFFKDTEPTPVAFNKLRVFKFFSSTWSYEHIFWLPLSSPTDIDRYRAVRNEGTLPLVADGAPLRQFQLIELGNFGRPASEPAPSAPNWSPPPSSIFSLSPAKLRKLIRKHTWRWKYSIPYRFYGIFGLRKKFADAWLLVDREDQANDNAEALYRYLAANRKDINAWFALSSKSPDFIRLKREGFKILPYRSKAHFNLVKEAKVLASAQADENIVQPFHKAVAPRIPTFAFLQHGVIHDSLAKWLNPKDLDLFVTSTFPEFDSIAGDNNPYNYSSREVALTGLPRHDRLHRLHAEHVGQEQPGRTVLIAPTWRHYLLTGSLFHGTRRTIDDFEDTEFVQGWLDLFRSETVKKLLNDSDTSVVLLLHPNLEPFWPAKLVPAGVNRISYAHDDIQSYLAQTDILITDFSSQAFEAAFCNAFTVYYQFDRETFYAGGHTREPGYFTYEGDGFGPVCDDLVSFEHQFALLWDGSHPQISEYRQRVESVFPLRDDSASARVVAEIERRLVPYAE